MICLLLVLNFIAALRAAAAPKPCCIPHALTADLHQVIGSYSNNVPATAELNMKVQYDYDAKKLRFDFEDGTTVLENYNTRKRFTTKGTTCTKEDIEANTDILQPCIPSNATYRSRHTVGGGTGLPLDTWFIENSLTGNLTISVMADDCTPVMQGLSLNANNGL